MKFTKNQMNCLIVALCFGILYFFFSKTWLLVAGGIFLVSAPFKELSFYLFLFWSRLGHALGKVNALIILTVLFFLILVPLSAFRRLLKKHQLPKSEGLSSSFIIRNHRFVKENVIHPW